MRWFFSFSRKRPAKAPPPDRRSGTDRRRPGDRRTCHDLGYFLHGGTERRTGCDRRKKSERRDDWVRVTKWCSISRTGFGAGPECGPGFLLE